MVRGYDSGRSHLLPLEATQHTKKRQTHIDIYIHHKSKLVTLSASDRSLVALTF